MLTQRSVSVLNILEKEYTLSTLLWKGGIWKAHPIFRRETPVTIWLLEYALLKRLSFFFKLRTRKFWLTQMWQWRKECFIDKTHSIHLRQINITLKWSQHACKEETLNIYQHYNNAVNTAIQLLNSDPVTDVADTLFS